MDVALHLAGPLEKAPKILALPPHEFPKLQEADLCHLHAAISLDPPQEIGTPPRRQAMAPSRIPQKTKCIAHRNSRVSIAGCAECIRETGRTIAEYHMLESPLERVCTSCPIRKPARRPKTSTMPRSTLWRKDNWKKPSSSTRHHWPPTPPSLKPCTGWRVPCRICSDTTRPSQLRSGWPSWSQMTFSPIRVCPCSIRKRE